jgi:hypothetical protein
VDHAVIPVVACLDYTALVNASGYTSFRVATRSAAGVAARVAFEVEEETRLRRELSEVYSFRALNTSFQSCCGGRRRWIEGWRVSIWRLAVSPGSSVSKPQ